MGFNFRKSFKLGAGLRMNVSKKGVGFSWGIPGLRFSKSADGKVRKTTSIPGTGISYTENITNKKSKKNTASKQSQRLSDMKKAANMQAENDLRIMHDCNRIIGETVNPEVFFMRLNLLKEKATDLKQLEPYIDFSGASPSAAYEEIVSKEQEAIHLFLVRYFTSVFDKAETLKTDRGKFNQYQKFYDNMQEYYPLMNSDNIDYVETKYKAYSRLYTKA